MKNIGCMAGRSEGGVIMQEVENRKGGKSEKRRKAEKDNPEGRKK